METNSNFKVLSLYLTKGGVGKSTLTSLLAFEMAKYGKVLCIDTDQQGSLTSLLTEKKDNITKTFLTVLRKECTLDEALIISRETTENYGGVYLLPTYNTQKNYKDFLEGEYRQAPFRMNQILMEAKKNGFNYVFIDLPPTYGFFEKTTLSFVNEIIPIVEPEKLAFESFATFNEKIEDLRNNFNAKCIDPTHLIINKINKDIKAQKEVYLPLLENIPNEMKGFKIYEFIDSKAVPNAQFMGVTMQEYQHNNNVCKTITQLAEDVK